MFHTARRGTHRAEGPAVVDYRGLVAPVSKGVTGVAAVSAVAATGVIGLQAAPADAAKAPTSTRTTSVTTANAAARLGSTKIRPGHRGTQVAALQTLLNSKGASIRVDGVYGRATRAAVINFQSKNGLQIDGVIGPKTRAALTGNGASSTRSTGGFNVNIRVRHGDRGASVVRLQQLLRQRGASITADGVYGGATRSALRSFQSNAGLSSDGVAGPNTWNALMGGSKARVTSSSPSRDGSSTSASTSGIVSKAETYLGMPYIWGASDPGRGFDCSGLVQHVYKSKGISVPRTAKQQTFAGRIIPRSQAKPGDLVVFPSNDYGHIGIYAGGNTIVDASSSHKKVVKRNIWKTNVLFVTYR